MLYKVSVIIPYYNRQDKIIRCFEQLSRQTLKQVEYIFIDDGSTDNSTAILNRISLNHERHRDIRILSQPRNMGVAAARTLGIKYATGEYIIHCDSDDYFREDALEKMYAEAVKYTADFVVCDCKILNKNGTDTFFTHKGILFPNKNGALKDTIEMATLWSHMARRDFILNNCIFPPCGINNLEDLLCVIQMYHFGKKWSYVKEPLYVYDRSGDDCITYRTSMKIIAQMRRAIDIIEKYNDDWELSIEDAIISMKMYIRDLMFDSPDFDKKLWMNTYPEVKINHKKHKSSFNIIHYISYCMAVDWGIIWPYRLITKILSRV